MHLPPLDIDLTLVDDKVRFSGALRDLPAVTLDYTPPLGAGQGYTALELFLYSLAGCAASTVLYLLRRLGKTVTACRAAAHGERRATHPTAFERITLTLELTAPTVTDEDLRQALLLAEFSLCPVWAMLNDTVAVTVDARLTAR